MAILFRTLLSSNRIKIIRQIVTDLDSGCRSTSTCINSTMSDAEEDSSLLTAPGLLNILENNPKRLKRIRFLEKLFKSHGFEVRIAGGAVRDILRGKEPKDIDFATNARPEQSLDIVKKHEDLLRIIVTNAGQRHGTIAVKFKEAHIDFKRIKLDNDNNKVEQTNTEEFKPPEYDEESPYEITTLRCDKITDGRHAEVEFIEDWRKDAERRDLTINAMFLTLDDGKLIDYYGGEEDLKRGIVRFVGDADQRIKEDYLRILRFFRFWSRYGCDMQPDEDTMTKLRNNMSGLEQISGERVWQELKKVLSHLPCYKVMELMLDLRLPEQAGLKDCDITDNDIYKLKILDEVKLVEKNVQTYKKEFLEPNLMVDSNNHDNKRLIELLPVIIFATMVRSESLCLSSCKRLKFSNIERDTILYIVQNRNMEVVEDLMKFQLVMAPVPERQQTLQKITAFLISRGDFDLIRRLKSWQIPVFALSGSVVTKAVKERKLSIKKTKDVIEAVKLEWTKSGYSLNSEELLAVMHSKLDEMKTGD